MFKSFSRGVLFGFFVFPIMKLWNFSLSIPMAFLAFFLTCFNNMLTGGKAAYDARTFQNRRTFLDFIMNILQKIQLFFSSNIRQDIQIPVSDDQFVTVTLIRAKEYAKKPLPVVFFIHGGGWVTNAEALYIPIYNDLIRKTNTCICYINYRLAPEYQHPIPIYDTIACIKYIHEHASELFIIPELSYIMGDSAGGMITASTVDILAREHYSIPLRIQVQVYPSDDNRMLSDSDAKKGIYYGLTNYHMGVFIGFYFHSIDEYCSVLGSPCIEDSTLPQDVHLTPACIITAENDPTHDGGYDYYKKLQKLNVPVDYLELEGAVHGCWHIPTTASIINNKIQDVLLNDMDLYYNKH